MKANYHFTFIFTLDKTQGITWATGIFGNTLRGAWESFMKNHENAKLYTEEYLIDELGMVLINAAHEGEQQESVHTKHYTTSEDGTNALKILKDNYYRKTLFPNYDPDTRDNAKH